MERGWGAGRIRWGECCSGISGSRKNEVVRGWGAGRMRRGECFGGISGRRRNGGRKGKKWAKRLGTEEKGGGGG